MHSDQYKSGRVVPIALLLAVIFLYFHGVDNREELKFVEQANKIQAEIIMQQDSLLIKLRKDTTNLGFSQREAVKNVALSVSAIDSLLGVNGQLQSEIVVLVDSINGLELNVSDLEDLLRRLKQMLSFQSPQGAGSYSGPYGRIPSPFPRLMAGRFGHNSSSSCYPLVATGG